MEATDPKRRNFIISLVTAVFSLLFLGRYLKPSKLPARGGNKLTGKIDELPDNSAFLYKDQKAAVVRSGSEIAAFSIVCTHLGCTLDLSESGFSCPCHGSRFNLKGEVEKGPATVGLRHLNLLVENGKFEVTI